MLTCAKNERGETEKNFRIAVQMQSTSRLLFGGCCCGVALHPLGSFRTRVGWLTATIPKNCSFPPPAQLGHSHLLHEAHSGVTLREKNLSLSPFYASLHLVELSCYRSVCHLLSRQQGD